MKQAKQNKEDEAKKKKADLEERMRKKDETSGKRSENFHGISVEFELNHPNSKLSLLRTFHNLENDVINVLMLNLNFSERKRDAG